MIAIQRGKPLQVDRVIAGENGAAVGVIAGWTNGSENGGDCIPSLAPVNFSTAAGLAHPPPAGRHRATLAAQEFLRAEPLQGFSLVGWRNRGHKAWGGVVRRFAWRSSETGPHGMPNPLRCSTSAQFPHPATGRASRGLGGHTASVPRRLPAHGRVIRRWRCGKPVIGRRAWRIEAAVSRPRSRSHRSRNSQWCRCC